MGGIGKTTLAKKVYTHTEVVQHFPDCRAWAYVSQDCRPIEVYMQIINQVSTPTKEQVEMMEKFQENQLGDFRHDHLKGKRYLIVLDDVWSHADWDCLARVSSSNSDCLGNVFPDGGTGEEMVDKCNGLPLAIIVLGGLLSKNMSHIEWKKVHDNISAYLAKEDQKGVMTVLNLSYIDLPSYLKPCFLHLSLFPEDYVISTRKLLLWWIAEGFVLEQDQQSMKDMAEVYFNELINRNLIQVAKEKNFIGTNIGDPPSPSTNSSKSRRQSIYSDIERYLGLRHTGLKMLQPSIGNLRSLQTLETNNLKQVPNVIWKMKNMRYLYIEGQEEDVPLQIDTLQNLQILSGITFNQWIQNNSIELTCLEKLKLEGRCEVEGVKFSNSIAKLLSLKSLHLKASDESCIPSLAMNSCHYLS
ncbi:Disease resistance protein RPP13 [Vitis vinifera]|uniref:Disease resistance protein RPP13 n=1 Tax=Vitis vinifera TaxID=29760 RepID=A0A438I9A9_VITVI|nr:Disease resistance protein RPP13 [Vitis vinifera]